MKKGACLVCGEPLVYFPAGRELPCVFCGRVFPAYAACGGGHYVCDACHAGQAIDALLAHCLHTASDDPIAIAQAVMANPYVHMHGPEHHVLVGAALLTAYKNAGGTLDLPAALEAMRQRGCKYPGGSCGYWGCCGAAVSTGMFLSILTQTTPLSGASWGAANRMTARALQAIGEIGGPRCCKRNTFTALLAAADFVRTEYGIEMRLPDEVICTHSSRNQQCLQAKCPYHKA